MGNISMNFSSLVALQKQLEQAQEEIDQIMIDTVKDIANEFLKTVIQRTPQSDTNQLKKSWKADLNVEKKGDTYSVTIINESEIASFVEYGHKNAEGGWIEGHFMMTITEDEVKRKLPTIAQKKIENYLKGVFK